MKSRWQPVVWIVALLLGAGYSAAATIGQAATWNGLWVGFVVAAIGTVALLIAIRALTDDRWAALAAGAGMMVTLLFLSGAGPGGSVVVPQPAEGEITTGLVWMFTVPIIVALVVAWPSRSRAAASN